MERLGEGPAQEEARVHVQRELSEGALTGLMLELRARLDDVHRCDVQNDHNTVLLSIVEEPAAMFYIPDESSPRRRRGRG